MKRLLKFLIALFLLLAVVFFLGAYLLPDRARISRQVGIDRPAGQVFAVVNDLHRFNEWSPWFDLDPSATYRHEGPERGAGSALHWSGNDAAGSGTLRIVSSEAPSRVETEVAFEGFPDPARALLLISGDGDASRVEWTFETALNGPLARWFGLLMPRYIGADYDKGLGRLKTLVESGPEVDFSDLEVADMTTSAFDAIVADGEVPAGDMDAAAATLGDLYGRLLAFAAAQDLEIIGQPLTLTSEPGAATWRFQAALPVRVAGAVQESEGVGLLRIPASRAFVIEHVGPYDGLDAAMVKLDAYVTAQGLRRAGPIRSVYVSDPGDTAADERVTRIVCPLAE